MKELCLSKSVQLSTVNKNRQNFLVENICLFKNEIVDISTYIPLLNISCDATRFHFAETKVLQPKFNCRKPGCSSQLTTSSHREDHERNVHPTIRHACLICSLYAENRITIDNHNVRCHEALSSTSNQRFVKSITFAIYSVNIKLLYFQSF